MRERDGLRNAITRFADGGKMPVTFELLNAEKIYLLRSGESHVRFGDPYTFSDVCLVNGAMAEIKGGNGTLLDIQGLKSVGRQAGIKTIRWERSRCGILIPHSLEIN